MVMLIYQSPGYYKYTPSPSWEVRYNIVVGIAEALQCLHNERSQPVAHLDVKSSNIFLSSAFELQIYDFRLAI